MGYNGIVQDVCGIQHSELRPAVLRPAFLTDNQRQTVSLLFLQSPLVFSFMLGSLEFLAGDGMEGGEDGREDRKNKAGSLLFKDFQKVHSHTLCEV